MSLKLCQSNQLCVCAWADASWAIDKSSKSISCSSWAWLLGFFLNSQLKSFLDVIALVFSIKGDDYS